MYKAICVFLVLVIIYLIANTWNAKSYLNGVWIANKSFLESAKIGAMIIIIEDSQGKMVMVAEDNDSILYNGPLKIDWNHHLPVMKPGFTLKANITTENAEIFPKNALITLNDDLELVIKDKTGKLYAQMYKA